jgi:hypothetical protein
MPGQEIEDDRSHHVGAGVLHAVIAQAVQPRVVEDQHL